MRASQRFWARDLLGRLVALDRADPIFAIEEREVAIELAENVALDERQAAEAAAIVERHSKLVHPQPLAKMRGKLNP